MKVQPVPVQLSKFNQYQGNCQSSTSTSTTVKVQPVPGQLSKFNQYQGNCQSSTSTRATVKVQPVPRQLSKFNQYHANCQSVTGQLSKFNQYQPAVKVQPVPGQYNSVTPSFPTECNQNLSRNFFPHGTINHRQYWYNPSCMAHT